MTRRLLLPLPMLLLLAGPAVLAQDAEDVPTLLSDKAPVVLDGRLLFLVGEAGTWSPGQRAREIVRTLRLAADSSGPAHLELAENDGYPTIRLGEWHLLSVDDSDVPPGMESGEQAQRWLTTVESALLRAQHERTPAYRLRAAALAVGVLLLAALLNWLLWRAARRLPVAFARRRGMRLRSSLGGKPGWQITLELIGIGLQVLVWLAALWWIADRFPFSRQLRYDTARVLRGSLWAPLFTTNERSYSAADLLWLIAAVALLWIGVSVFTRLVSTRLQRATDASSGALQPVATLLKYGLIFVGVIVITQLAGLNLSSLAIFASVLGVGIGFGLQSIANNFVSGIIISFERPITPGDFVTLGNLQGTVERIGGRSTVIRTLDRVSIIVPNSRLLEQELVNWSYGDPVSRLHLPVCVAHGADVAAVRAAILEAAKAHAVVLSEPRPEVRFLGFDASALNFELLVWCADPARQGQLRSDLYFRIEANLRRAGITLPSSEAVLRLAGAPETAGPPPPASDDGAGTHVDSAVDEPDGRYGVDLEGLVARMRGPDGLTISDRRHLLHTYARCFVGREAVDWLVRAQDVTRDEAVRLGQLLVDRGIIHHVLDEHPFRDAPLYYRFFSDEPA